MGISLTVFGEPASKANQRKLVMFGKRPAIIKSDKARAYAAAFLAQVPVANELLEGELSITIKIFYRTQRPDLDPSLIFDLLQGRVYQNDRQLREQHLYHFIDKDNPRAEIYIEKRACS